MDLKVDQRSVVCFDLDDTLYNEIDFLRSAYREIAQNVDEGHWESLFAKMFSLYRKKENVFDFLMQEHPITLQHLLNMYHGHIPDIVPFTGVLPLFDAIKAAKGKICIITDGRSITQRNKLKALGVLNYLDLIIISEEIGSEKPGILNYSMVEQKFPDCQYTYVADNFKKDFIMPNQRNWNSIGLIDNGLNIHNTCFDHQSEIHLPKHLILKFEDIKIV